MLNKQVWDDRYNVGHSQIDQHHKNLFKLVSATEELMQQAHDVFTESDQVKLNEIINKLYHYTEYHFGLEERLMEENGYDKLVEHKQLHSEFRTKILKFQQEVLLVGPSEMLENIFKMLSKWLVDHILFVDQDMAKMFKDKKL